MEGIHTETTFFFFPLSQSTFTRKKKKYSDKYSLKVYTWALIQIEALVEVV